jgi:hypothetical protein
MFAVPDWLAERNISSWREVIAFYQDFFGDSDWVSHQLRLVRHLAESEYAMSFRAGTSLWFLLISTSIRHGLKRDAPYISVITCDRGTRFSLEYCSGGVAEQHQICDEAEVLLHLKPILTRLWNDPVSEHERLRQFAMGATGRKSTNWNE